ncbi:MAG: hypothetical protein IJ029_08875 [Lachnospiraceae bacterium]|nr:hypothetical protein [Lachnospiraceae bacterium]
MNVTEVIVLILGILVFILSYLLPAGKKDKSREDVPFREEEMKEIFEKEVAEAKSQIQDIVDETITYSMEKTERSMERLTNEKIMAVNEYSDTVLEQINKNHKEAVFLYDMLNDKHQNLKETVSEATKTVTEVKQTVKEAEAIPERIPLQEYPDAEDIVRATIEIMAEKEEMTEENETAFVPITQLVSEEKPVRKRTRKAKVIEPVVSEDVPDSPDADAVKTEKKKKAEKVDVSTIAAPGRGGRNSNERILELHKAGKSNMAIAKELGLGIGEVKLVIDLFEGI